MPGPEERRAALALGREGEERVARALEADGWRVLARNWRGEGGELDLVVERDGCLRFVEVKTRAPDDPVGLEAVGPAKRRRLVRAAREYLAGLDRPPREAAFMVALVEGDRIEWVDDAFDAGS